MSVRSRRLAFAAVTAATAIAVPTARPGVRFQHVARQASAVRSGNQARSGEQVRGKQIRSGQRVCGGDQICGTPVRGV